MSSPADLGCLAEAMTPTVSQGWAARDADGELVTRPMRHFEVFFSNLTALVEVPKFAILGSALLELEQPVNFDDLARRIVTAWKCLTLRYPLLRMRCTSDMAYEYRAEVSQASIDAWAQQTVQILSRDTDEALTIDDVVTLNNALSDRPQPDKDDNWAQLRSVVQGRRFALTIRISHNIVDAGSVTILINELLTLLANGPVEPPWGSKPVKAQQLSRLPVAMGDLVPEPDASEKMSAMALKAAYMRARNQCARKLPEAKTPFGKTGHGLVCLDERHSSMLLRFARANGITVSALLHAAVVFRSALTEGIEKLERRGIYQSEIPVDPRAALPSSRCVGLYAVAVPIELPLHESLKLWQDSNGNLATAVLHLARAGMENIYGPVRSLEHRRRLALNHAVLSDAIDGAVRDGFLDFNTHLCEMFSDSILDGGRYLNQSDWARYDGLKLGMLDYDTSTQVANTAGIFFRAWNVNQRSYIGVDWSFSFHDGTLPIGLLRALHGDILTLLKQR